MVKERTWYRNQKEETTMNQVTIGTCAVKQIIK